MPEQKVVLRIFCMVCPDKPKMINKDDRSDHLFECPKCGHKVGLSVYVENLPVDVTLG